ncbi:hypothetical protein LBMAG33_6450 [Candidatus Levyibacteriota bacterium]|nr:hypothetical protein [Candidatus Levybacteria bacterium]MSU25753.1 hypothetical protein [Candidatus Levybacteria bacterium]GDX62335.1 hypothetical protein LBMAG33_6450 [Candidatus Levybacteria bacterium]
MENKNDSRLMNSFLLGAIVGSLGVFLVGTKKGKKILEALTEEGLSRVDELLDNHVDEKIKRKPIVIQKITKDDFQENIEPLGNIISHAKRVTKRLFKGIPRR